MTDCIADRLILPNAFIDAAEEALHYGQFLSRPTIWTVQAIAMLTLCGHNVCESDLLSSLLAVGIKTAQTLRLHMLGGPSRALKGATPEKIQEVELGKRLWWSLAQEVCWLAYTVGMQLKGRTGLGSLSGTLAVSDRSLHFMESGNIDCSDTSGSIRYTYAVQLS